MGLIQGKGKPIPKVPLVGFTYHDDGKGPAVVEVYGDVEFYVLDCGHTIETCNVDAVANLTGVVPCLRCWEALLGTEDAE